MILNVINAFAFEGFKENSTIHCYATIKNHCEKPGVYDVEVVTIAYLLW